MKSTLKEFIENFKAQFELLEDHEEVSPHKNFREMDSWDSLTAIMVLDMIDDKYGVSLDGDDLRSVHTIEELYKMIKSKT